MSYNLKYNFNAEENDSTSEHNYLNYVICSTPRSGSTMLAKALHGTGIAGLPHEYFNIDHKSDYQKRWEFLNIKTYISILILKRVTDNGVFGFKLHYNQYEDEFGADKLGYYFNNLKYIFITREDKILQGISLEKASQTQKWSSEFSSKKRAKFNYLNIKKRISEISKQEKNWLEYFKNNHIEPFIVNYESLEKEYEKTIHNIIMFLGIEEQYNLNYPEIKKQRSYKNYVWKFLYLIYNFIDERKNTTN